ncbi:MULTISPECIES: hypothetical protein [unclassified Crossiella]|uniref:DUF7779 domain-containing protein n=1 Tax=unclassified Crossiella TaxID=2620835 RepID=UPI0020000DF8|nr:MULTISPECIES: hypothetical protein [unclassified Crossiella]MCK2245448.1 hypothetical protein [Crossiella sp. S99.2]MCK2259100.1 hypothetical protein [Crossiella sp. S99.1]
MVTTRRRDAALFGSSRRLVQVELFTPVESLAFLNSLLGPQAERAAEPAERLGHLPLALAQSAAYVADRPSLTCAGYLTRWVDRRRMLAAVLPAPGELPDEHRETVTTTWSLSIERANELTPAGLARPLLELLSLLDPNGIPNGLITAPAVLAYFARRSGRLVEAEDAEDALVCLHRMSLITYTPANPHRAIRVHALVQRTTYETCDPATVTALASAATNFAVR